jgi:putative heme iron utilization protein
MGQSGKQASRSFLKKRTKKLLLIWQFVPSRLGPFGGHSEEIKVFCFFFSKKKRLPSRAPLPGQRKKEAIVPDPAIFAARCLLRRARAGTLATQMDGQPFASLVTPVVAPDGAVLVLLSSLATHTRHLLADARCALMVMGAAENANPQTAPRVTVTGLAERCADPALRRYWVARHPYAALYADFSDFSIWRLLPQAGHYVGGFANATSLPGNALLPPREAVAALAEAAPRILAHCNEDHREALNQLAGTQGKEGAWQMLGVDTDGIDLVQDDTILRVAFHAPVADAAGVRAELVRLLHTHRSG